MKILKWILGLFSPYAHPFERKVDRFFRGIKSTSNVAKVRKKLLALMQENLVVVNLWLEKRYKGYKYLNKRLRREMYRNLDFIVAKFKEHGDDVVDISGLDFVPADKEKVQYLALIMSFLRPGHYYEYLKASNFGRLLRNPNNEKMKGDCNQIVTFYIYLYSLKFPISDLEIKLLPEHVCLHFKGIDIEATNATFEKYDKHEGVLPVTEIISTNLLDLVDLREDVMEISDRDLVKSAQLAYSISSLKSVVAKNLNIAYRRLALSALKSKDFKGAIFYFGKAGDRDALVKVYHDAAVYFMEQKNFSKAVYYADLSRDEDLIRLVSHNEGVYYFKAGNVDKALDIFKNLADSDLEIACYAKKYDDLSQKVASVKTIADVRKHKGTFRKMLKLAQKMRDDKLVANLKKTLAKI